MLPPNVCLDRASTYSWEQLNERCFLERSLSVLRDRMGDAFDSYSFHVFAPASAAVWPASSDDPHPRKVLLFISDESMSVPLHLSSRFAVILKSYLSAEVPGSNIFALNIGTVDEVPAIAPEPMARRRFDLFFSGNLNANRLPLYCALHPLLRRVPGIERSQLLRLAMRSPLRRLLRTDFGSHAANGRNYLRFSSGFKQGLAPADYGRMLADSKIVLCPPGFTSPETFRHIEALRAGAAVICQDLPDTHLYRDGPFVRVANWREGLSRAAELLRDEGGLEQLQRDGLRWYEDVLSEQATATYIHGILARTGL